ncbi:hypothetical protein SMICM17S_12041 [Streptomyces microflavus]
MASLRGRTPATGVYRVRPSVMARRAPSAACSGVGKSSSPPVRLMMSAPSAMRALISASRAAVLDAGSDRARLLSTDQSFAVRLNAVVDASPDAGVTVTVIRQSPAIPRTSLAS